MRRGIVNRVLLGIVGAALLAAGVLVLAGGLDLYGRLGADPPGWWPLTSPDQPVVSATSRTRWVESSWWWPTVIGGLSVLVVVMVSWLVVQLRRTGLSSIAVPTSGVTGLRVRVSARTLEEALETGTAVLPEVERAGVRLVRAPGHPRLRGAVRLTPGGDPAALVEHFETGPRADALGSLGVPELPADLRIRVLQAAPAEPRHWLPRRRRRHPRVE
ncbi:alkaline shock response membrane anchor protein AmaP [Streptomyces kaniharaensis]|uniref:Alkaline shock response membrane anchor protein AmaP n=1 Tax=Streptomyces kaniharaensis TaxID=212423 RepID=A0A6N7KVJ2_9ACTN|nr:alkaline shock response membrane anchor protein AmaP [Streptomyces kaniharaensis]MQS14619.1 alkaline shock response membrane anchor protein AmaP [Streptomyces kaniharaensis]